jgi:hypothetical protein
MLNIVVLVGKRVWRARRRRRKDGWESGTGRKKDEERRLGECGGLGEVQKGTADGWSEEISTACSFCTIIFMISNIVDNNLKLTNSLSHVVAFVLLYLMIIVVVAKMGR